MKNAAEINQMTNTSDLPRWDLSDFYSSPTDPRVDEDLATALAQSQEFAKAYEGKFSKDSCDPETLYRAIKDREALDELTGKLGSYAFLNSCTQISEPKAQQFLQKVQEKLTELSSYLVFFSLDLNTVEEKVMAKALESSADLRHYKSWIDNVRLYRDHELSPDLEKLLLDKSVTGHSAWVRLCDETLARTKFKFDGEELTESQILDRMNSHKDPEVRRRAAVALNEGLSANLPIFVLLTNTLAKDKEIEDKWRNYPNPVSSRNLANQVEDEVVEALVTSVKAAYPKLAHRYYAWKTKRLGLEKMEYWDRNAPLPDADDERVSWDEAKEIVHEAYGRFSPELAAMGKRFFDNAWIDVPVVPGKRSGAFAHPTVDSVHPYLMLNYLGKKRDVMTLAHELGHGVHQLLASPLGPLLSNTPLTIAETASVFGEMLTFRALLEKTTSIEQRRSLISSKVDDMINTVVRQVAFHEFEKRVHSQRREGELSAEDIGKIWIDTQTEALGPSVNVDPMTSSFWSYVTHFIHVPFYVYSYAFGDCLVNSLYSVYQEGHPGFAEKYLDLLRAGGSKRHPELLAPFNLDARDPQFWAKGMDVISNLIDELESLG